MNKSTKARLIHLNARLSRTVEFAAPREKEDESHVGRNLAILGGAGAAAYGGSALYRGYKANQAKRGYGDKSVSGMVDGLKTGNAMNVQSMKDGVEGAKTAYGKAGQAVVNAKRASEVPISQAMQSAKNIGRSVARGSSGAVAGMKNVTNSVVNNARRKLGRGNISRFPVIPV
jgi:hypothetical protein